MEKKKKQMYEQYQKRSRTDPKLIEIAKQNKGIHPMHIRTWINRQQKFS